MTNIEGTVFVVWLTSSCTVSRWRTRCNSLHSWHIQQTMQLMSTNCPNTELPYQKGLNFQGPLQASFWKNWQRQAIHISRMQIKILKYLVKHYRCMTSTGSVEQSCTSLDMTSAGGAQPASGRQLYCWLSPQALTCQPVSPREAVRLSTVVSPDVSFLAAVVCLTYRRPWSRRCVHSSVTTCADVNLEWH